MHLRLLSTKMRNSLWCPFFFVHNNKINNDQDEVQEPIDSTVLYRSLGVAREKERQRMFDEVFQELVNGTYPSKTFSLSDYWTQDELDVLICDALENNKSITTIDVIYKLSSGRNIYSLSTMLQTNNHVQELNFSTTGYNKCEYRGIGDNGLIWICEGLQHNQSVKCLKIRNNQITTTSIKATLDMLRVNQTLIELDISENFNTLQREGTQCLCDGLLKLSKASSLSLQKLHMRHWHIDAYCGKRISKLIAHSSCKIDLLDLEYSSMSNKGAKFLCQGLAQNKSISTLALPYYRVSPNCKQVKYISSMLIQYNTTIRHLKVDLDGLSFTSSSEKLGENQQVLVNIAKENYFLESFLVGTFSTSTAPKERKQEIDYYMKLNKAGRKFLQMENSVPMSHWMHAFEMLGDDVNGIYFFMRSKPELCKHVHTNFHSNSNPYRIRDVEMIFKNIMSLLSKSCDTSL